MTMSYYSQPHICQCLGRLATAKRNSVVTISGTHRKTGLQFVDSVINLATGLLRLGLRNGDVVAISAFNSDSYLELLLAVAYIGGMVAPLNYRWSFEEARFAMSTVSPVMLVTDESSDNWPSLLRSSVVPSLRWHISLSSSSSGLTNAGDTLPMQKLMEHSVRSQPLDYSSSPEGAVLICFTSGTTGRSKGVTISHSALIVQSLAKVALVGYGEDDVYLHTAPLCHIGGLSSALAMLMVGACHVVLPKFEALSALETIETHHVTSFITVPAMMADIISSIRDSFVRFNETWKRRDSVKKILNGGGGLSNQLIQDAAQFFPRAKLLSAYGMTEACSSLTFMTLFDPTLKFPGTLLTEKKSNPTHQQLLRVCVGKPAPHIELKICSDNSSLVGRILTRGPHLMLRYWDQPPEKVSLNSPQTQQVWFDTGDVGFIDDSGNLWLIGRTKGRIKSGGENVYPEQVEALLLEHPGVTGAVVVGIPDARLTEMVVACIRLKENWHWSNSMGEEFYLSTEILRNYCRLKNLSGFKIPRIFIPWRIPFPLTTTGKVRRDRVRVQVVSKLQALPLRSSSL